MQKPHVARGHLLPLDGVRGLAILMVMGCHAFESNYEGGSPMVRAVGEVLHYGNSGVDLFFVLSGFLITGILYDSLKDHRPCLKYPWSEGFLYTFLAVASAALVSGKVQLWHLRAACDGVDGDESEIAGRAAGGNA